MLDRTKVAPKTIRTLSQAEISRVDQTIQQEKNETRNRALFHLCIHSGLRISEIVALTIDDVASKGRFTGRISVKTFGKSERIKRRILISEEGLEAVRAFVRHRIQSGAQLNAPLFFAPRTPEQPISANVAWSVIRKSLKKAGIRNVSTFSLRRTFVKSLVEQGANIIEVQKTAGYKTPIGAGNSVEKAFLKPVRTKNND